MRVWFAWAYKPKTKFTPDGHSIAKCETCLRLLSVNAGLSLIWHLTDEHKLPENDSIETVKWISARVLAVKLRNK